jgi:uncharacterized membrane protein YkvA (DUF1232 family)
MTHDPFPRERVAAMVRRMPAYLRLSWRLGKDPLLSKARRAAVIGAAGYLASPVDLVPGVIPVLGQLDDIAVALAALRLALGGLDAERRRVHLEAVGLEDGHLAADLRTVGATTGWIGRAGYRTTKRAAVAGGRAAGAAARTTRTAADKATPAAKAAAAKAAPAARAVADRAAPVTSAAAPAARAMADRAAPAVKATGRAAKGAGTTAARTGRRVAGAASAAISRVSRPGERKPTITVRQVDVPLLPPGEVRED